MSKSKSKNAVREETRKRVERKFKEETERLRADNKDRVLGLSRQSVTHTKHKKTRKSCKSSFACKKSG